MTSTGTATPSSGNPIRLGLAGDISANFVTGNNGSIAAQQADALSWYGSGTSDSMSAFQCGDLTGTSTACPQSTSVETPGLLVPATGSDQLYPFYQGNNSYTGNYHVWAGQCRQEEPPSGVDTFTISPGYVGALSVQEPEMNISVSYNGSQVTPSDIVMQFKSTLGTSCTDTWSTPIAPAVGSTPAANALLDPGQPFANTSTTTNPSASGYTGSITVCADYKTGFSTYRYAKLSGLTNTSFSSLPSATTIPITSASSSGQCSSVL